MSGLATPWLRAALAFACAMPLLAGAVPGAALKKPLDTPLRFAPPAAGPVMSTNAGYQSCIDQPSPDGLVSDCQALLRPAPAARAKPRHR